MQTEKIIMHRGVAIPVRELKALFYLSIPDDFTGRMEITFKDGVITSESHFMEGDNNDTNRDTNS